MPIHGRTGGAKKEFKLPPPKTYQAVCFGVWDIGDHWVKGEVGQKLKPQVYIGWELSEVNPDTTKRFTVFKKVALYFVDKGSLLELVESWLGRKLSKDERSTFDVETLIGQNCFLNIAHNTDSKGNTWANIKSISPILESMDPMAPINSTEAPPFIQKLISSAVKPNDVGMPF